MANLTEEQKTELTRSGVLKDLVGKSWDDPEVQKKANEYYNSPKLSGGSSNSGSSGGSSNNNTKTKPAYPKTIDDYKNDYNAAKGKGDSTGMKAANDAANAIRRATGQREEFANVDIASVANANKITPTYKYSTPVKTIEDYSNDYAIAKAKGDSAGMKAANDAANAIRRATGQKEQIANVDIASVANANVNRTIPGASSDIKPTPIISTADVPTQARLERALESGNIVDKGNYYAVMEDGKQIASIAKSAIGDYLDVNGGIKNSISDPDIPGLTRQQEIISMKVNVADLLRQYQSATDPAEKENLLSKVDNAFRELMKAGAFSYPGNKSVYDKYNPADFDYGGKFNNPTSEYKSSTRQVKAYRSSMGQLNSDTSDTTSNAVTSLNNLDKYRTIAEGMLKPQFDKAVEEQMKVLTNRMVAQGYQGQMPAEAMRVEIMSNLQADFQSQVSTLAQQLMQQDIANERYADETAYNRSRDAIANTRYNTEYADQREDINYERTQNELDKSQKREIDNIMMYYSDLKAEADRRKSTPDTSDDFLIPYLLALREEKKITEGLDDNGKKISSGGKLTYDQALKLWQTYGVATKGIADVLGVEVGAKTEDYLNTEYDIKKPYYKESSGSSGSNSTDKALNAYYDGFIAENMNTDGESLYANLVNNQSAYIEKMGSANFTKAVKFARDKYYQTVISRWRGNESGLLKEIQSKPEYYQNVLGIENYNKMINELGKTKASSDGW